MKRLKVFISVLTLVTSDSDGKSVQIVFDKKKYFKFVISFALKFPACKVIVNIYFFRLAMKEHNNFSQNYGCFGRRT